MKAKIKKNLNKIRVECGGIIWEGYARNQKREIRDICTLSNPYLFNSILGE